MSRLPDRDPKGSGLPPATPGHRNPALLVFALCLAEFFSMAGFSTFSALQPPLERLWALSSVQSGWINGIFFGGYTLCVPVLVSATDRMDPRRIMIAGLLLATVSSLGFAVLAGGFPSALALRALAGAGLAGTYMPGLRALTDHYRGERLSRAVSFYTSTFGIGVAMSYFAAGEIFARGGWRAAFVAAGAGSIAALILVTLAVPAGRSAAKGKAPLFRISDLKPVLRNRTAMAYMLAYGVHCWELFTFRSWIVAFLVFRNRALPDRWGLRATTIASVIGFIGVPSSILGNELAERWGRSRTVTGVTAVTALAAAGAGLLAPRPTSWLLPLLLLYGVLIMLDSGTLTAGAVDAADPGRRGATMAVHSTIGFFGAFLGPLVFGVVLDVAGGGANPVSWGVAFGLLALGGILGPMAVSLARRSHGSRGM